MIVLRYGSSGSNVLQLQKKLIKLDYKLLADGKYGNKTLAIVKQFQLDNGLESDGIAGYATQTRLDILTNTVTPTRSIWTKIRKFDTNIWYAVLPQKKYFVDFELGAISKFEKLSTIVKDKLASGKKPVCAINGGYFGGTNIEQMGLSIDEGSYRNAPDIKLIDLFYRKDDNRFHIANWNKDTPNVWAQRNDFYWAMGTTYSLVQKGKINLQNVGYHSHAKSYNPRTIVGQRANGDIVLCVADGRSLISKGLTATQSAQLALWLGMVESCNEDGGGSTTGVEVVDDTVKVINVPSDGSERKIGSTLIAYERTDNM